MDFRKVSKRTDLDDIFKYVVAIYTTNITFAVIEEQVGTWRYNSIISPWPETKFSENKAVNGKTPFFIIGPICTGYYSNWHGSFYTKIMRFKS